MLLYIDPGTGSMLFALVMSLAATVYYLLKQSLLRVKAAWKGAGAEKNVEKTGKMPYVIFTDDKRYWEMFKPICDGFERQAKHLVYWTCSPDDPGLNAQYKYVKTEYIGDIYKASIRLNRLNAGICLTTTPGLEVYQWKRSDTVDWYVHMVHGAGDAAAYKMLGLDFFDAVLVVGRHQRDEIREIEAIRQLPEKEICIVGEPHMDFLKKRLESMPVRSGERNHVLLAPSWGETALLSRYGEAMIEALLKTDYHITIRPHPQTITSEKQMLENLMRKYPDSDRLTWNFDHDNFDALYASDVMISDFSSVIWDYVLVFGKPIIYADVSFDPTTYDLAWTSRQRWDFEILSKIGYQLPEDQVEEIGDYIERALRAEGLEKKIETVREEAWGNIGAGATKIVDYMMQKQAVLSLGSRKKTG